MALKDLTIDQGKLQEELIENSITLHVRYDTNQKMVVFLPDASKNLSIPKKILVYLLALKGWQYVLDSQEISQEAQPKDISKAIMENGSTVRNNLQILLRDGFIQKNGTKYSISTIAINKIQDYLQNGK